MDKNYIKNKKIELREDEILMRCPVCKREERISRSIWTPKDAVLVVCTHLRCFDVSIKHTKIQWFNANGKEIR